MTTAAQPKLVPSSPSPTEIAGVLDAVREGAFERESKRIPPFEQVGWIRDKRLGALRLPRERGGAGFTLVDLYSFVIEFGEADPSLAHALRNHYSFVEQQLLASDGDANRWLGKAAEGLLFGLASTEVGTPKVGSGGGISTTLAPDGDGYVLNGVKFYTTGSIYSDLIQVRTIAPDGALQNVIIPAAREGVIPEDDWDGIGQRLSGSGTTRFVNVRVQPDEVQPPATVSKDATFGASIAQLYLTAIIAGILRSVSRDAVKLITGRARSFYHAPAEVPKDDPILQQLAGELSSVAYAAEAIILRAAAALDRASASARNGALDPALATEAKLQASKAKIVIDKIALEAATALFDAGGASAALRSKELDRHWRNIRTLASHNPRSYKARNVGQYVIDGTPLPTGAFF